MNIYTHNLNSKGARLLSNILSAKIIKHEGSIFKGDRKKVVINWGASTVPKEVKKCKLINKPTAVAQCQDKLKLLTKLSTQFDVPAFTINEVEAKEWEAAGINVFNNNSVYTMDVDATQVFRVHQIDGQTIYVQYKDAIIPQIHEDTKKIIKRTVEAVRVFLGLDFCCVSVGWCEKENRYYILNVNTAPELDEDLAIRYANYLSYGLENGL